MILVGMFLFLVKLESSYIVCLGLVAAVLLYVMTSLLYHLEFFMLYHFR